MDPNDIRLETREDGSLRVLGSGTYGKVRPLTALHEQINQAPIDAAGLCAHALQYLKRISNFLHTAVSACSMDFYHQLFISRGAAWLL